MTFLISSWMGLTEDRVVAPRLISLIIGGERRRREPEPDVTAPRYRRRAISYTAYTVLSPFALFAVQVYTTRDN